MYKLNIRLCYFFLFYFRYRTILTENRIQIVLYLFLLFRRNVFLFMENTNYCLFYASDECLGKEP